MAKNKMNGAIATKGIAAKASKTEAPEALERHDVIAMARKFADDLEAGEYGEPLNVMLVLECKQPRKGTDVQLFGWGSNADGLHGLGMLTSAVYILQS